MTAISLAPLGMISQQGEPGSAGRAAEGRGRRSEREGEPAEERRAAQQKEREREAMGTSMVI